MESKRHLIALGKSLARAKRAICLALLWPLTASAVSKSGTITSDETWSGAIETTGNVTIAEGTTVTVDPGAIIKFAANTKISVDGTFNAIGTVESPIHFTSIKDDSVGGDTNGDGAATTPAAGDWTKIEALSGSTANIALEHVTIRYSGGNNQSMIIWSGKLSIDNVSILDSLTAGILISGSGVETYSLNNLTLERIGSTISHYGVGAVNLNAFVTCVNLTTVDVGGRHVSVTKGPETWASSGSSFSGTGIKMIEMRGGTISSDLVWDDDVPYLLTAEVIVAASGSLTLPPGTVVFGDTTGKIRNQGILRAEGTAESPIVFTSIKDDSVLGDTNGDGGASTPAAQDWNGLQTDLAGSVTTLTHCSVHYASSSQNAAIYANNGLTILENCDVRFSQTRAIYVYQGDIVLRDNVFSDTTATGIWFRNHAGSALLIGNHFENCATGVYAFDPGVQIEASGSSATNCGVNNGIKVSGSTLNIQDNQIWQENLLYYSVNDLTVNAGVTLTLGPGTKVKIAAGKKITIAGDIEALGTSDSPVQFTSFLDDSIGGDSNEDTNTAAPAPGDWAGIIAHSNATVDLNYTEIHYGATLLRMINNVSFQISNSIFSNSSQYAILLETNAAGNLSNNIIREIAWNGVHSKVYTSAPPTSITNNTFENTGGNALYYSIGSPFYISGNSYSGGIGSESIRIRGGTIPAGTTVTLEGNRIYRILDDGNTQGKIEIAVGGSLIVEAGAILKFDKYRGIRQDGHMELRGAVGNPVILTSVLDDTAGGDSNNDGNATTPAPGDWMSIWIRDTFLSRAGKATGLFENVEIRYGGLEPVGSGGTGTPAILLDGGQFEMNNISILESLDVGFRSRYAVGQATINGMNIVGAAKEALSLLDGTLHLDNISIDEIDGASIELRLGNLDFSLSNFQVGENVPNNITRLLGGGTKHHTILGHTPVVSMEARISVERRTDLSESSITVLPGTVVKVGPSRSGIPMVWSDGDRGHFILNGEPENPIIFTSLLDDSIGGDTNGDGNATMPNPGDWDGFIIQNTNSQLNNVEVRYAGNKGEAVTIGIWSGDSTGKSFTGLHIHDTKGDALVLDKPKDWDISNSLLYDFEDRGIYSFGDRTGGATFRNLTIHGGKTSMYPAYADYTLVNSALIGASESAVTRYYSEDGFISRRNLYYSPGASLDLLYDESTGQSWTLSESFGDLFVDPKFADAANNLFFPDVDSPLVDAANGSFADGLDFYGFPRFDEPAGTDTGTGTPSYVDIGAIERLGSSDPTLNPDLAVDPASIQLLLNSQPLSISNPNASELRPGSPIEIKFTVSNDGGSDALGNWEDAIYFSRDSRWDPSDVFAGSATRPSTLVQGASYQQTLALEMPNVIDASYYLIVKTDFLSQQIEYQDRNNTAASNAPYDVDVNVLPINNTLIETFSPTGSTSRLYRLSSTGLSGKDILITVSPTGGDARTEIVALPAMAPSSVDFAQQDLRFNGEAANIQTRIGDDGDLYVLIEIDNPGAGADNVSIKIVALDFSVRDTRPAIAGNGGPVTLIIDGASFQEGDLVTLRHSNDGDLIDAQKTLFRDSGTLTAPFLFSGDKLGKYDVIVKKGDSSAVLVEGFELVTLAPLPPQPKPDILITSPDFLREQPLVSTPIDIAIHNPFSYDIPAFVRIEGSLANGDAGGLYSLSSSAAGSSNISLLPVSEEGQPGMLAPGETIRTKIYYSGPGEGVSTGGMIHQDAKSIPVDDSPSNFNGMDGNSFHHSEFNKIIGSTVSSMHKAISEEAERLKELGFTEMDADALLDSIYSRITGIGDNSLGGSVYDGEGNLLKNQEVILISEGDDPARYTTTTDGTGAFVTDQLPSGSYFIAADGFEPSGQAIAIHGGKLVSDSLFTLAAHQDYAANESVTQYQSLTYLEVESIPHLFFVRRGIIMHTTYVAGAWTTARIVGPGQRPLPIYAATLVDGAPAIAVFHTQTAGRADPDIDIPVDPNDVRIMVAIALPDGSGGWIWHDPTEYAAHDTAAFSGFDVTVDDSGVPIIMWLASDISNIEDDTDLYFNRRALTAADVGPQVLNFATAPEPLSVSPDDYFRFDEPGLFGDGNPAEDLFFPLSSGICRDFKTSFANSFSIKLPDRVPAFINRIFGSNSVSLAAGWGGEANLREGKAEGTIDLDIKFLHDKKTGSGLFATGQGRFSGTWKLDPKTCKYEFAQFATTAGIRIRSRVPIPNLSFSVGPIANIAVGIQVDGIFGGAFKWDYPSYSPTSGNFFLETGVGGYAVGSALGGSLSLSGSLTGNLKIEASRDGVNLKDIFIKGSIDGKIGPFKRTHGFKYSLLNETPSALLGEPIQVFASATSFVRNYRTPEGWDIVETITRESKIGTTTTREIPGVSQAVTATVGADTIDQSAPSLISASTGAASIWIDETASGASQMGNALMYSEFDGSAWNSPISLPGITGANREVQAIRDVYDRLIVVFAHADVSGVDVNTSVEDSLLAYDAADICYIRQTNTGWTAPVLTSSQPGMAASLKLHRLPDGTVYLSWIEHNASETDLYIQKWDADNLIWLAKKRLNTGPVSACLTVGLVEGLATVFWAEIQPSAEGADDLLGGELIFHSSLNNGVWSEGAPLALAFDDFFQESAEDGLSQVASSNIDATPISTSAINLEIFDLNKLVLVPIGCCDEPIQDVPELDLPKIDVPDARQWPGTVGSLDPNDKFGANGHGPEGWIGEDTLIPYTVHFENDPDEGATAPALRVVVTDQLDSDFDYTSFRFREFGWGALSQDAPEDSQGFETIVPYQNSDGSPLNVKVIASFDSQTGLITMRFDSIDPDTGISPYGYADGFLQIEDGTGNGQGHFSYEVRQKPGLSEGTDFRNIASIVFDLNDAIETPEVVHTIDLTGPTSQASSPAVSSGKDFTVQLSGEDGSGSGVAFYNVYRSVNGGPYSLWVGKTYETSLVHTGEIGRRYSFYSVATDWVGIVEGKTPSAETTTLVEGVEIIITNFEALNDETVRFTIEMPDELASGLLIQISNLDSPVEWIALDTVVILQLEPGRYQVTATTPPTERSFFRIVSQ